MDHEKFYSEEIYSRHAIIVNLQMLNIITTNGLLQNKTKLFSANLYN